MSTYEIVSIGLVLFKVFSKDKILSKYIILKTSNILTEILFEYLLKFCKKLSFEFNHLIFIMPISNIKNHFLYVFF